MRCYALGSATRAAEVLLAFAEGLKGAELIREANAKYKGTDIVLWGLLRGAKELREQCKAAGHNYYAVDHAYIGRQDYFRVTRNGFQQTEVFARPPDRWEALSKRFNLKVKPWRRGGEYILLAMSSSFNYEYFDCVGWEGVVTQQLRQYTDRPIVVRKKHEKDLQQQLARAWCVVTHTSMVAVDAVLAGVPVYVTGPSVARPMGLTDLSKVEEPVFPDREAWFRSLAYAQFDLKDMKRGVVKPALDEYPYEYDHRGF
jgi:hypothetical protein